MSAPLSLLLIEDDDADREWVARNLKSARIYCDLSCAADGQQATALLGEAKPPFDVVLIDFGLPDIDAMDLLRHMRDQPRMQGALVVAVSGSRDAGLIHGAMDLGVQAFMSKPFSPQALMDTLTDGGFWLTFKRPA